MWHRSIILAAIVVLVAGCRSGEAPAPRPNVVLITLDTTRADHLSCYGYSRKTSPNLDALAATGTRYDRAFTTAPWTLPTHASIFTGRFPAEHGVRRYKTPDGNVGHVPIPEDLLTLGEMFHALGYDTAAYTTNQAFVQPLYGFARGMEMAKYSWMYAPQLIARVKRWLDLEREKPFFLFINLMDAHYPYNVRPVPGLLAAPPDPDVDLLGKFGREVMPQQKPMPVDMRDKVIDQYDTAIANLDAALGDLFDTMRERGTFENTVFVVTSDHGEVFGDWDIVGHGKGMYTPLTRALLITRRPGQTAPEVADEIVSSVDIPQLLLDMLPPDEAAPYREKFPHRPGNHPIVAENHFAIEHDLFNPAWGHRFDRSLLMWLDWPWKYVDASDGAHELYNLVEDPAEQDNRYADEPARAAEMAEQLKAWREPRLRDLSGEVKVDIAPEDAEAMKALGYL